MSSGGRARILPAEIELTVEPDETVFAAARRTGYRWPTVCGGEGQCTVCQVRILDGTDAVQPPLAEEAERLLDAGLDVPEVRLACRLQLEGDVTVRKPGVRAVDPE